MATSWPAAIAARARVVPNLPAPTMPRRRSSISGMAAHAAGAVTWLAATAIVSS
jgi:hypothetical protein